MDINTPENFTVVDGYALANPFERIIAFMIDVLVSIVVNLLFFILLWFIGLGWISGLFGALYLVFRDCLPFLKCQSVGKKIMKLKVIDNHDKMSVSLMKSFKRNFIFLPLFLCVAGVGFIYIAGSITCILLMIELYLLYTSSDYQRLGDQFAETLVIESAV